MSGTPIVLLDVLENIEGNLGRLKVDIVAIIQAAERIVITVRTVVIVDSRKGIAGITMEEYYR